ncbi:MAG: (2Fe-2S)-binding protein, partial [Clostridia bacterium]|nr:(2Fe-2S)-binding protein [Clostridia bacterium]
MSKINIKINGIPYEVDAGITILEACQQVGIKIPTLCYLKGINEIGACRICLVEVKGARSLVASCVYPVSDGMEIRTNTEQIRKSRKTTLELILSTHDKKCLSCDRSGRCELQDLCHEYGLEDSDAFEGVKNEYPLDFSAGHLVRNNNKCIVCRRCEAACREQFVGVIGSVDRGFDTNIACAFGKDLGDVPCVNCGQCIVACPTGALTDKTNYEDIFKAIEDPEKVVIFQTAPSVRATLGEYFGNQPGTNVEGKMVAAIRRLGVDKVFDTDFGADLTILEEANEFIERVQNGGVLPLITSCSPGWVKFAEFYHPDMLPNISSCKSPQQMT